jgi:perosamine synthetase
MSDDKDDLWLFKSYADEDDVAAVTEVLERGTWWAKGPEVEEFERTIADRTNSRYGVAFNSGTSALYANLVANDITDGEVIVPSFTFSATANAVVAAGAKPVFADIERDSLALDPSDVTEKITPQTRAIMPIHFAGDVCAGIRDLREIANDHDILLFEDAAHSPGATLEGEPVGSFGKSAMFSFCFNKILTTGEGGMVVTDDETLRDRLKLIRSHGRNDNKEYVTFGHNFRMSSMTAALGVSQAEKLDYIISRRREMARDLNEQLAGIDEIHRPVFPPERNSVYQLYNIRLGDPSLQSALQTHLSDRGIPTRITYDPVHLTNYYQTEWGYKPGDLPITEDVSEKILTLPFHLDLTAEDLDRIASGVRSFFE